MLRACYGDKTGESIVMRSTIEADGIVRWESMGGTIWEVKSLDIGD